MTGDEWAVWWHRTDDRGIDLPECADGLDEHGANKVFLVMVAEPAVHFVRLMKRTVTTTPWEEHASVPGGARR